MASTAESTGAEAQKTGDAGEDHVRALLTDAGLTVNPLPRDLGEDFIVELGGRAAAVAGASSPKQAYVQVKSHAAGTDEAEYSETIQRKHLYRWAFQQLPVFLVSAVGPDMGTRRFFVRAIDEYLAVHQRVLAPDTSQRSFNIRARHSNNLAADISRGIEEFYKNTASDLSELDETKVVNNHIEFVKEDRTRYVRATSYYWAAIWKSPARPATFAMLVEHITRRARDRTGGAALPAQVTCFLYRSQAAMHAKQWVARVHWHEIAHPQALESWKEEGEVVVTERSDADEVQQWVADRTTDPATFAAYLVSLADRADSLVDRIIERNSFSWSDKQVKDFRGLEEEWEQGPFAPPGLHIAGQFLSAFLDALDAHRWTARDLGDEAPARVARWREQELTKLKGYRGATRLLLKAVSGES